MAGLTLTARHFFTKEESSLMPTSPTTQFPAVNTLCAHQRDFAYNFMPQYRRAIIELRESLDSKPKALVEAVSPLMGSYWIGGSLSRLATVANEMAAFNIAWATELYARGRHAQVRRSLQQHIVSSGQSLNYSLLWIYSTLAEVESWADDRDVAGYLTVAYELVGHMEKMYQMTRDLGFTPTKGR